ncbi:hypothetical protein G647_04929 [Cladophialophora carrionii CBS 160.54]|uniref:Uncharacterized protein n=1 Tax=Cladophialophora carrionii CBS 160.54 TaxID=1279043 RepID=V9DAY4_9EURO|nr:uncharacterized protein G647_04929 [Cladophialophora carrionii CBS 160.54]ETI23132.1 hypothetical protein G647_04929 [Cladophialophora carrionii CBS 160.54]
MATPIEKQEIENFRMAELLRTTSINALCRSWFLDEIWGIKSAANDISAFDFYFEHYEHLCSAVEESLFWLTHSHAVCAVQRMLTQRRGSCVDELLTFVPPSTVNKTLTVDKWMAFVAHSLLFMDISKWQPTETLPEMIDRSVAVRSVQDDSFRLPRSFNARTIAKVAGINVQWTTRLTSHLEVSGNDCDVAVFHCGSVLELYQRSKHSTIFPDGFLAETGKTMSLLLPKSETSLRKWLLNEKRQLRLDGSVLACPYLRASERNIRCFDYYRERLIILKEVFDEHEPRGIGQFWRDDRKPVQWWTFWIAIVVFVLTLVGCVEGALQVYKAYYPEGDSSSALGCRRRL